MLESTEALDVSSAPCQVNMDHNPIQATLEVDWGTILEGYLSIYLYTHTTINTRIQIDGNRYGYKYLFHLCVEKYYG
jgi:hypothetical protein